MPWMPGAIKRDVGARADNKRFTNGLMRSHLGLVLHCNDAHSGDLYDWIVGNHGMSCHFQVSLDGKTIWQYIDTSLSSWAQVDGNGTYLSVETSGFANENLTPGALNAVARIFAWVHNAHAIPVQAANAPGERGLGWHGMGAAHGVDWGHSVCPGIRKLQIPQIVTVTRGLITPARPAPTPAPTHKPSLHLAWPNLPSGHYFGLRSGPTESHGGANLSERRWVTEIQKRLRILGFDPGAVDGDFGQRTKNAVSAWQHKYMPGTQFYGQIWKDDWTRLFTY